MSDTTQEKIAVENNGVADKPKKRRLRLTLQQEEIEIEEKDGSVDELIIRELTGKERDTYLNTMVPRMAKDAKGKPTGVRDFKGMQLDLIVMSTTRKSTGKLVTAAEVTDWPSTTQTEVYKIASRLSALDDKAVQREKKD
jgi:hypothetical protein